MNTPDLSPTRSIRVRVADMIHNLSQWLAGIRWAYMLVAFCLAATLWYLVTVRDKVETWVDIPLGFKDIPSELVVRDGLITKVSVRVRAAKGLSNSLNVKNYSVVMNLSSLTRGLNVLPIEPAMLPFTGAFEVVEISPPSIQVIADTLTRKELPLQAVFEGSLLADFFVKSLHFSQPGVLVHGPEAKVSRLQNVKVPVPLDDITELGFKEIQCVIPVSDGVSAEPTHVTVRLEIGINTKTVRMTRPVVLNTPAGFSGGVVKPAKVTLTVDVPLSLVGKAEALADIKAVVSPAGGGSDGEKYPVTAVAPETFTVKDVSPKEVLVQLKPES